MKTNILIICDCHTSSICTKFLETNNRLDLPDIGPALADTRPNARTGRWAPLRSDFMTSSCSVNRVTIVVERKYAVQHKHEN